MENTPANSILTRWSNRILIFLFMGLIWLPTLDTFFHFDHSNPPGENRLLAEFPQFKPGIGGLKKFITGWEAYFNDHFGFRKRLIRWDRMWRLDLFRDQKGFRSVIAGKDNWFYFAENQMVEHYRGTLLFTPEQLQDWQKYLESYRDWLGQRGIKFLFVIVPEKQSIYPENLPSWLTKVQPETKLDQFFKYMKAHSTVDVLDLRPSLLEARLTSPTYLKNDSHWNQFGAFMAYQTLVKELASRQLPGIQPVPLDAFERVNKPVATGDLIAFGGINTLESNAFFFTPKPFLPRLETIVIQLPKRGEIKTITQNPKAPDSAVVYYDSMGAFWIPFLGYNFGRVTYIPDEHLTEKFFDPKFLNQEKPTVVVIQVVEHYFNIAKPREIMALDALP